MEDALADFRAGHRTVVAAETPDGSAASLVAQLPDDLAPSTRVTAGEGTRARAGCLAREMGLDRLDGQVVVIEQAQWGDPTSLGRIQRQVREAGSAFLLVLSWAPDADEWGVVRLRESAREHSTLHEVRLEDSPTSIPPPTDPAGRDLVLAAGLLAESISVAVAARFLQLDEDATLDLAESLVASGHLCETRGGFHSVVTAASLQAGEARTGHVAGRLAVVLQETDGDPAALGYLLTVAGEPERAYPHLVEGARIAARKGAAGEAHHLAIRALEAADQAGLDRSPEQGELHLVAARYLRVAGRSEAAASHLEEAVTQLEGVERIDALGYAAAVADDRQRPQEAERILAVAEWEAARQEEVAKLGSLSTFRARALNRLGFATEANAVMEKAKALLAIDSSPVQRVNAETNQAWIAFDRGQARLADTYFTHVRDLTDADDDATLADREAWRARVLFAIGRPDEALAAVKRVRELAARAEVEAPLFLVDLALAEGNLVFGRHEEALNAVDRVLDLVERQLPAWENVSRANRALILARMGKPEEAGRELEAARAATPRGADGWRWRRRIEAVDLEARARAGRGWDRRRAEDLVDLLLQAQFFGWAAELMCLMAEQDNNADLAEEAMALALRNGNPVLAARAAQAGKLWRRPGAGACVRAVRAMEGHIPEDWEEDWRSQPGVSEALSAPEPRDEEAATQNAATLERAFHRAGLSDDGSALSPAQRRKRGLVPRRGRPRWGPLRLAAAVVGVVGIAALTSVGIAQLDEEAAPVTVTIVREAAAEPPPEEELTLEETQIDIPADVDVLDGSAPFRGGPARTGIVEATGTRRVDGYYWRYETAGPIIATPIAYGRNLLVPSTDGTLYAIDQTRGDVAWTIETGGRLTASSDVATAEAQEGQRPAMAVIAGEDGVVRARNAVVELESEAWSVSLGSGVTSTPVIAEGKVFVATIEGVVHALDLVAGEEMWRHPAEGEGLGTITAPLAYDDGVIYVGSEEGNLHLLEAETGEERCNFFASADIVASPVVSEGAVYIPTRGNTIFVRPAGACSGSVPGRLPLYGTETPVEMPPAIVGDVMYLPSGQFLYAIDLEDNSHLWSPSTVDVDDVISAPPVVADGVVYIGTRSGLVRAVDGETGETLWEWTVGNFVRASPVVVDGAVFVAGGDGVVYALGAR